MSVKVSQLHPQDILNHIASMTKTAQYISIYEKGNDLAWEIIGFVQETAQEAANCEDILEEPTAATADSKHFN